MKIKKATFPDYGKFVFDSINAPRTKEEVSCRSIKHVVYAITNSKVALRKSNDNEIPDDDKITP